MVVVDSSSLPRKTLDPGERSVGYAVPHDQWFVLTSCSMAGAQRVFLIEEHLGSQAEVKVGELFLGKEVNPQYVTTVGLPYRTVAPIGIPFRPGSTLEFVNVHPTVSAVPEFLLSGYLVARNAPDSAWPPHPKDIVVFDSSTLPGHASSLGIPFTPNMEFELLSVPQDRDFVLTSMWTQNWGSLYEDIDAQSLLKLEIRGHLIDTHGLGRSIPPPIGIVFRAGSRIALRKVAPFANRISFGFVGYYR